VASGYAVAFTDRPAERVRHGQTLSVRMYCSVLAFTSQLEFSCVIRESKLRAKISSLVLLRGAVCTLGVKQLVSDKLDSEGSMTPGESCCAELSKGLVALG
jgi:hypothetical protein